MVICMVIPATQELTRRLPLTVQPRCTQNWVSNGAENEIVLPSSPRYEVSPPSNWDNIDDQTVPGKIVIMH